ncbi:MAG: tetratricopeptide repeat protein [Armatimonadota bacterium]|nr:tetratricopeptide repeat protein [Armatimonadota bacterium]MCX7778309.1 tetratricopeptide repeat protein [Armatimonadota bacterium]MDW8025661.1 tetratricopeptide repeat protein [Armatimonadota bacterium]
MKDDNNNTCKVCGAAVPKAAIFCPMCGARLERERQGDANPAVVEMVEQFSKRVSEYPNDAAAHYNLALALLMLRRWGAAAQSLEKVIQLEPSFLEAYFYLARVYIALGNLDAARAVVSEMMKQAPDDERTKRALKMLQRASEKRTTDRRANTA